MTQPPSVRIGRGQFIARFAGDFHDRLDNGKIRLVRPIWNGMLQELTEQGYEPEVHEGKIYIRLVSRQPTGG